MERKTEMERGGFGAEKDKREERRVEVGKKSKGEGVRCLCNQREGRETKS